MFETIIKRLTPRLLAIVVALAIVVLAVVVSYALFVGGSVDLKKGTFKAPDRPSATPTEISELNEKLKEQQKVIDDFYKKDANQMLAECKTALSSSVPMSELAPILGVKSTAEALGEIRRLAVATCNDKTTENNLLFKLYQLETIIPDFGKSITTRYDSGNDRTKAFVLIQEILRELTFYDGSLDGDQKKTNEAVIKFQENFNSKLGKLNADQKIQNLGAVGYKTLEAMRSAYRQRTNDA